MDRPPRVPSNDDASSSKRSRQDKHVSHPVIPVERLDGVMVSGGGSSSSQRNYNVEKLDLRPRKIRKTTEKAPSPIQRVPTIIDLTLSDSDDDKAPPPPKPVKQVKSEPSSQKSKEWNFLPTDSSDSSSDDGGVRQYSLRAPQNRDEEEDQLAEEDLEEIQQHNPSAESPGVDELKSLTDDDWPDLDPGSSLSPPPTHSGDRVPQIDNTVEEDTAVEKETVIEEESIIEKQPIKNSIEEVVFSDEDKSSQALPSIESTSTQASNEPNTPKLSTPELIDKHVATNDIETPSSTFQNPDKQENAFNGVSDDDDDFYSTRQRKSPESDDDDFVTAEQNPSSATDDIAGDTDFKRLPRKTLKTGYVYDPIMSLHAQLDEEDYEPHPEDPRRIYSIYKCMEENGLLKSCVRLPVRQATRKEVLSTHDPRYVRTLEQTKDMSQKELEKEALKYNSIYMNAHSNDSALFSAGGVIEACSAVATDKVQNAFAIVRPPGHHAEFDTAMGFCLMNNVAIATRYCKKHFPFVERILILDWDIHFGNDKCKIHDHRETHYDIGTSAGNGTQQLTSRDADILYMSLHRYEKGTFYPQDSHGRASYVGHGSGKGRTVNIPWPNSGMTDGDYLYAFREIVMPIAMEFAPSLVIVSAGFDGAAGDHIGECYVTPAGYGQMTYMLKSLANGRIVLALEGGYNLESIAKSAHACMSVLVGEAPEIPTLLTPSPECVQTIRKIKEIQSEYWDCLKY